MSANHSHHHHHHSTNNLKLAFFINLIFTIFEIIGGFLTNSVAILSDAVHDLGDSISLGVAWYLQNKSNQEADHNYSFGYARFSLLGALINSVILLTGSLFIITEAISRFQNPETSDATGMMLFAIVGIAVNGYAAWKVSHGHSMNERIISWHLIEDVLGWVAILIGSIVLYFKNIPWLDPALSLGITLYILWNVIKNLKETLFIFLQGIPKDINANEIENSILSINYVDSVHHTHIWSLEGQHHVFTCHVKLKEQVDIDNLIQIKADIKYILSQFSFKHYTIEFELYNENCGLPNQDTC